MKQLDLQHAFAPRSPLRIQARPDLWLEGDTKRAVEQGRRRLVVAAAAFAFAFLVLALRASEIAVGGSPGDDTAARSAGVNAASFERADIVDRNGVLLASTLPTASLYANPARILDVDEAVAALMGALPGLDQDEVLRKLSGKGTFAWIKRGLSPAQESAVHALGLPGIQFQREQRRVYPQGALAAHIVGFTDVDNQGLAGIEKAFDDELRRLAIEGEGPLTLSLDVRLQQVLRDELAKSVAEFRAIGGTGMIVDPKTGEILAIASLPDFDPNHPMAGPDEARFNRATLGVYEMGSIFKVFTTAMALDGGKVGLVDGYDASEPIRVARYTISDSHAKSRWLSIPEIFIYSSNIGAAKMAMDVGAEGQKSFLKKLGFFRPPAFDLPEVGEPIVPATWGDLTTMTVAFGHGLAISPLQTVTAFAAMVNGGTLRTLTLLRRDADAVAPGTAVIKSTTSDAMRALLRLVVMAGTGKSANVPGYAVGGKTGTAEKASAAGYRKDALLSSFIGAFPMDDPRYVVLVTLDEPKGTKATYGYATGGWTAAPTVARIIDRIGPLVGMAPRASDPTDPTEAAEALLPGDHAVVGSTLASLSAVP